MTLVAGDQRIVSVLMADVVGSTMIGERLGPERSKFLFDEVASLLGEEVRRLDGTVAQLTGDGLFALFGAPLAHEDDAERAVRAAMAMQRAIAGYGSEVRAAYGVELAVRVAINTGPVVLPTERGDAAERYNALGDTVNVAARLQDSGESGGVVVSGDTARLVEDCFELEELGSLDLRGRDEPVRAYRVTGVRSPAQVRADVAVIGRDFDLAVLDHVCTTLVEGSGAIVAITGEAGIGKTRLVVELQRRAGDRVRFVEGRAVAYAQSLPYGPIRDLLRDWLGVGADAPEARVRLELKAALSELPDLVDETYPHLAQLLGLPLEPEVVEVLRDLGREARQRRAVAAVACVVRHLAGERPLCLILDDLHWADDSTLDLIEELLALTEETQLGVVLVYRSERDRGAWRLGERARQLYPHRYREVELRALAPDASRALATALAEATLPPAVADLLTVRAGGNPFFLEEALQDLVERGALRRNNGSWELAVAEEDLAVPALVQGALQARLDRLAPATREVVSVAAVIGRSFGLPLLEQLLPHDQVAPALSDLMRLDLVAEVRRRPSPEYRFRHGLVQEVAYASLLAPTRCSLHRRIGEALEASLGDSGPQVHYGLLARHFAEACDPAPAAHYLLAAGDAARAIFADREAVAFYQRARDFLAQMGDAVRERETLFRIALVHHLAFDFERAEDAYDAAFCCRVEEEVRCDPPSERLELSSLRPDSFAPGASYTSQAGIIIEQLYRGLLRVDADLNVVPELAQNMRVSSDGLTYLFMLREGVFWSDGHPLTMGDFVYAWRRLREEGHVTAFLLDDVASAEALDDWTLEVRLHEPRNYFPYVLGSHWAYPWPRHRAETDDDWRDPDGLIGNGPFLIDRIDAEGARLVANPHWQRGAGNVGEVLFTFHDKHVDTLKEWRAGCFDFELTSGVGIPEDENTIVQRRPMLSTTFLGFNTNQAPLDDVRLRRALAHAIDRPRLLRTDSHDQAATHGGAMPPAMPGHTGDAGLPYDPDRARALLSEAGYCDGRGLPELRLLAPSWLNGDALMELWAAIGVRSAIVPGPDHHGRPVGDAHAWLSAWHADYPDPDGFYHGLLAYGDLPFHRDEETDALYLRARSSRNRDERLRLYHAYEHLWIGDRAALVPIAYARQLLLRRPHVRSLEMGPMRSLHLEQVVVERG